MRSRPPAASVPHRREKRLGLRFNRLRQETPGALPQNRRQWVLDASVRIPLIVNGHSGRS
jgi:hypothetical protein